ncbi:MAG: hypothetical protein V4490_00315, partial [Pseudomonadota bacterium]
MKKEFFQAVTDYLMRSMHAAERIAKNVANEEGEDAFSKKISLKNFFSKYIPDVIKGVVNKLWGNETAGSARKLFGIVGMIVLGVLAVLTSPILLFISAVTYARSKSKMTEIDSPVPVVGFADRPLKELSGVQERDFFPMDAAKTYSSAILRQPAPMRTGVSS